MRFRVEHVIDASLARVEAAALDPASAPELPRYVPALAQVEVLERATREAAVVRVVRYRAAFEPPPYAIGFKREMAQWLERSRWDLATHACAYAIEPNIPPAWRARFRGEGIYRLEARGEAQTARVVEGEIAIDAPLFARAAEKFTLARMRAQYDGEARMLSAWVKRSAEH
jgi:hypothetical protein